MITRSIAVLGITAAVLGITGCSSLHEVVTDSSAPSMYRHYDPCIRCGESWIIVPNAPMSALHQSRNQPGFTQADREAGYREMYGPNWREILDAAQGRSNP